MAKQTFTSNQVLTAAQMTSLQQTAMGGGSTTAKTTSYVLVAADAGTTVAMNAAGSTTITVNTGLFSAGDSVFIQNWGAGTTTVTAGTATVSTHGSLALSQWEGGQLYFTSSSAAIFFDISQSTGMTNPMTTTGDTIYSSSGSTPAALPIGSTGQVLTVASGLPSWATIAAPSSGLTLIKRASFSNVTDTSTTFDSMFSSTYGAYQIVIETLYSNTDQTNDLQMQWRYAGPNTQTSSYNGNNQSTLYNSTTITSTANNAGSSMLVSLDCGSSTAPGSGSMLVTNAFGSSGRAKILGSYAETDAGRGCTFWQATTIDRTYTGFLLKASATNITGTVAVYGLAKS
jgi:hypothetical protein